MQQVVCDHMAVSITCPQTTTNFATKTERAKMGTVWLNYSLAFQNLSKQD